QTDRVSSQSLHNKREIGERRRVGQRLANDAEGAEIKAFTRCRDGVAKEIVRGEEAHVRTKSFIGIAFVSIRTPFDLGLREFGNALGQRTMAGGEKWSCFNEGIHEKP